MNESQYWEKLAMLINLAAGDRDDLPGWCDWFEPKKYYLGESESRVTGSVGFVDGSRSEQRKFTLFLGPGVRSMSDVDWSMMLPRDGAVDWFSIGDDDSIEIGPFD